MNGILHPNSYPKWTFLLLFLLLALSCKEEEEGCTDITANNWNAIADKPCESCCTYPKLELSITHVFADTTFNFGDPFSDSFNNVYSLLSIRFYLSNFSFKSGDKAFIVSDSLKTKVYENTSIVDQEVRDDAILVTKGTTLSNIGDFPINGELLDSLSFDIGLVQPLNSVVPTSLASTHPLAPKADSMFWDEARGYIFQRLEIIPDTAVADTLILEIGGDDLLKSVSLPYGQLSTAGFDVSIPMKIDYKYWFKGINFAMDTPDEMKEKIVLNITESFSISN